MLAGRHSSMAYAPFMPIHHNGFNKQTSIIGKLPIGLWTVSIASHTQSLTNSETRH